MDKDVKPPPEESLTVPILHDRLGHGHHHHHGCCGHEEEEEEEHHHSNTPDPASCHIDHHKRFDWLLWGSLMAFLAGILIHLITGQYAPHAQASSTHFQTYGAAAWTMAGKMWWGVALGIFFVGLLSKVPREFVVSILGKSGGLSGILRATLAGVLLDMCSHGILLVGMKLYERGASLGQTMAFLIASPWNSLSLTFILTALIGLPWTLAFIALSMAIAIVSGLIFERLVAHGTLPSNPNQTEPPPDFAFFVEARRHLRATRWNADLLSDILKAGLADSAMILRWVFFGAVLASLIQTFVPTEDFRAWFGPSMLGLLATLIAATVIEVCSEGSSPIAADILTRAGAPGNSFAFLMTGVSTDYTEIMSLKERTKSWKIALYLPLVTIPQVILISWLLNLFPKFLSS